MKEYLEMLNPKTVFGDNGLFVGLVMYIAFFFCLIFMLIPILFKLLNEWSKSWFGGESDYENVV